MSNNNHEPIPAGTADSFKGAHELKAQLIQPETEPELPPIDAHGLQRDFIQSFLLANGDSLAQQIIMSALANSYAQTTDHDSLVQAMDYIATRVDEYRVPRNHLPIAPENYHIYVSEHGDGSKLDGSFQGRWADFSSRITEASSGVNLQVDTLQCLGGILLHDIEYQTNNRPGRGPNDDSHMSVTRQYILGDDLQGSAHLLKYRDQLRHVAMHGDPSDPDRNADIAAFLKDLQLDWEYAHSGTAFLKNAPTIARKSYNAIMKPRTVHIIGAGGLVGASSAAALVQKPGPWDIRLIDIAADVVAGQALDLGDATAFTSDTHVRVGEYKHINEDDIVVITSGVPRRADQSRLDLIGTNAGIMTKVVESVMGQGKPVFILVVSNPVDIMTRVALKVSGLPPERVFGTGTTLDTSRLVVTLAAELKVPQPAIDALVLGEHGDSSFTAFEAATVSGRPLTKLPEYSLEWADMITDKIREHAKTIIETKKSTHWGIGAVVAEIVETLTLPEGRTFPVCSLTTGQYGLKDVVLGLPSTVSDSGVKIIDNFPLPPAELRSLQQSAAVLEQIWTDYQHAEESKH